MIELALYQPDIAQNTGTLIRLAACMGVRLHVIEPTGFDMSDRNLRRAGMDYLELATVVRHMGWTAFSDWRASEGRRLVLATTRASTSFLAETYRSDDILLMGRESAGVPDSVHAAAGLRIRIPMMPGTRSLNLAVSASMILSEALRQTDGFPPVTDQPA
ncbi:tRNA (cytidine(34)-2'-O)-methyltransferase [Oryzibacter oryziterrae]|uniref:tRNA (cytidine(34)-2'-O)-methyltransferase n=1 Tax=Oryzibacter oryziterrae TaxID=2766474 RepID=UPI001F26DC4E|nr:tRNA (cytidine(34)-2'-O)-methyltransferase [Oryzibacter oryziterrae]